MEPDIWVKRSSDLHLATPSRLFWMFGFTRQHLVNLTQHVWLGIVVSIVHGVCKGDTDQAKVKMDNWQAASWMELNEWLAKEAVIVDSLFVLFVNNSEMSSRWLKFVAFIICYRCSEKYREKFWWKLTLERKGWTDCQRICSENGRFKIFESGW